MLEYDNTCIKMPTIAQVSLFLYGKHVITLSFDEDFDDASGWKSKEALRIIFRALYKAISSAPDDIDSKHKIVCKTECSIRDVVIELKNAELKKC